MYSKRIWREVGLLKLGPMICALLFLESAVRAQDLKVFGGPGFFRYAANVLPSQGYIGDRWSLAYLSRSKPGFLFGAGIEAPLLPRLSLEIDVLYVSKGGDFDIFLGRWPLGKESYDLRVLSFPLLFKARLLAESSPYLLFGGELSYVLAHKEESASLYYGPALPQYAAPSTEDLKPRTEVFELGLVFGGGMEIRIKGTYFFIEARYSSGLGDILKKNERYPFKSVKTRGEAILVGLRI